MLIFIYSCVLEDVANDGSETASMIVEYNHMNLWDLRNAAYENDEFQIPFTFNRVQYPWAKVGMAVKFSTENAIVPPYEEGNIFSLFPSDDASLRAFAIDNNDIDFRWHLYSLNRNIKNEDGILRIGGIATLHGENVPHDLAQERYSMIFMNDLEYYVNTMSNTGTLVENLITAVVHELGHQRAGLTHATGNTNIYHDGLYFCVMKPNPWAVYVPTFCFEITDPQNQVSSCKQNIENNFQVY